MRLIQCATLSTFMILLCACSNRATYDNLMLIKRNQCLKDAPFRHEECMFDDHQSYEEYRRQREAYLQQQNREDKPEKPEKNDDPERI